MRLRRERAQDVLKSLARTPSEIRFSHFPRNFYHNCGKLHDTLQRRITFSAGRTSGTVASAKHIREWGEAGAVVWQPFLDADEIFWGRWFQPPNHRHDYGPVPTTQTED